MSTRRSGETAPDLFSARPIANTPEPPASRHLLPKDLTAALKRLDDAEIDALLAAVTERGGCPSPDVPDMPFSP